MFQPVTNNVIPARMPESSHRDVKLCLAPRRECRSGIGKLPSMALDTGMTVLAEVPC